MRSIKIGVEITGYIRVILGWYLLISIITENTRESFVNRISIITKIACPSSTTKELNFDSKIVGKRCVEVVRWIEFESKMGMLVNLFGKGIRCYRKIYRSSDIFWKIDLSRYYWAIMLKCLYLKSISCYDISNCYTYLWATDCSFCCHCNGYLWVLISDSFRCKYCE